MTPSVRAAAERLEALLRNVHCGPLECPGMIGDFDSPLRWFLRGKDGKPIVFSEPFAADYAGIGDLFKLLAAAFNDAPLLARAILDAPQPDVGEAKLRQRVEALASAWEQYPDTSTGYTADFARGLRAAMGE